MIDNPTSWTLLMSALAGILGIAFYYKGREDEKKGIEVTTPRIFFLLTIFILFSVFLIVLTQTVESQ